jgi:hypothetical protein
LGRIAPTQYQIAGGPNDNRSYETDSRHFVGTATSMMFIVTIPVFIFALSYQIKRCKKEGQADQKVDFLQEFPSQDNLSRAIQRPNVAKRENSELNLTVYLQ